MTTEPWTIRRLLTWTTEKFKEKNIDTPKLDAELLLAHALGCPKIHLYTRHDQEPDDSQKSIFKGFVKARLDHVPVAYLLGKREFYLFDFEVTPATLIPRPDTETLVLEALKFLKPMESPAVLDIGTGTGCIPICIAKKHASAVLTAVDISEAALEVARRNADKHGVAARIDFRCGDLWPDESSLFDMIVSNPPYISETEWDTLQDDVRKHEPKTALLGGVDGLDFYRRIIPEAKSRLKSGGRILLEIGYTQGEAVRNLFASAGGYSEITTFQDPGKQERVVAAKRDES